MKQKQEKNKLLFDNIDILGSTEFDLSEALKDLIYNIKIIKQDVDKIKEQLK